MSWVCPSCGQEWPEKPLVDGTIGCPSCGNVAASALVDKVRAECMAFLGGSETLTYASETVFHEDVLEMLVERDTLREDRNRARDYVAELHGAKSYEQLTELQAERDEALRRMDEALAEKYTSDENWRVTYEEKIQYLAQETLRNSELRASLVAAEARVEALEAALREIAADDVPRLPRRQVAADALAALAGREEPTT